MPYETLNRKFIKSFLFCPGDELEKYFITALDEKGYPTGAVALSYYKECIKDELRIKCEKES